MTIIDFFRRPNLLPGATKLWNFFLKFAEHAYIRSPTEFVFDLLRLDMPMVFETSHKEAHIQTREQDSIESDVRKYIRGDERISRRLLVKVDILLVRTIRVSV